MSERFWRHVSKSEGCWNWTAAAHKKSGYGAISFRDENGNLRHTTAHRISWVIHNGAIPNGMHVLHSCDNRLCCNPADLFLGTNDDNVQDKVSKGRQVKGVRAHRAKLKEFDIPEIRKMLASGMSAASIGKLYSVSFYPIWAISKGIAWKHIH